MERIVDRRQKESRVEYLIRWKGKGQKFDTWELAERVETEAPHVLGTFLNAPPNQFTHLSAQLPTTSRSVTIPTGNEKTRPHNKVATAIGTFDKASRLWVPRTPSQKFQKWWNDRNPIAPLKVNDESEPGQPIVTAPSSPRLYVRILRRSSSTPCLSTEPTPLILLPHDTMTTEPTAGTTPSGTSPGPSDRPKKR